MTGVQDEGGLTIYVGDAGERYSDPDDWRELVEEGRLRADSLVAMRRDGELFHQKAGEAPELARLFGRLQAAQAVAASSPAEPTDARTETPAPTPSERVATLAAAPVQRASEVVPTRALAPRPEPAPRRPLGGSPQRAAEPLTGFALFRRCLTRDFSRVSGRAGRREFWSLFLGQLVVLIGLPVLAGLIGTGDAGSLNGFGVVLLIGWALFAFYIIVPSVAVTIRRLHDLGVSAWVLLIVLVPYVGGLLLLLAAALPSQAGANRYGPAAA